MSDITYVMPLIEYMKEKYDNREDKDNMFGVGVSDTEFRAFIIYYLLGENWYVVDPLGQTQINEVALYDILQKYSKRYRKEKRKQGKGILKYKLTHKGRYLFEYEKEEPEGYIHTVDILAKTATRYKGIEVASYESGCNSDGFSNAVGMRREELFRLPFWILHFKLYRLFKGFGKDRKRG